MSRISLLHAFVLLCASSAWAQAGTAPRLTTPPYAPYPDKAREAHVTGEAVVSFSIDAAGKTVKVHIVSGPELLAGPLQEEIESWRFVTPLPRDAQKDFIADYTYNLVDPPPPPAPAVAAPKPAPADVEGEEEIIVRPGPISSVSGVAHSVDNRQTINVTPMVRSQRIVQEP